MTTRQRSQMPSPPASYRTPLPTPELSQDGMLHPALTPHRRPQAKERTVGGVFHRLPSSGPQARPSALPGYAPSLSPSDRARDDRLFEDLVANAADATHTRDRDELELDDDFSTGDFIDADQTDEIEKAADIETDETASLDDEETAPETPED